MRRCHLYLQFTVLCWLQLTWPQADEGCHKGLLHSFLSNTTHADCHFHISSLQCCLMQLYTYTLVLPTTCKRTEFTFMLNKPPENYFPEHILEIRGFGKTAHSCVCISPPCTVEPVDFLRCFITFFLLIVLIFPHLFLCRTCLFPCGCFELHTKRESLHL